MMVLSLAFSQPVSMSETQLDPVMQCMQLTDFKSACKVQSPPRTIEQLIALAKRDVCASSAAHGAYGHTVLIRERQTEAVSTLTSGRLVMSSLSLQREAIDTTSSYNEKEK